jgi:hypothetical protein
MSFALANVPILYSMNEAVRAQMPTLNEMEYENAQPS